MGWVSTWVSHRFPIPSVSVPTFSCITCRLDKFYVRGFVYGVVSLSFYWEFCLFQEMTTLGSISLTARGFSQHFLEMLPQMDSSKCFPFLIPAFLHSPPYPSPLPLSSPTFHLPAMTILFLLLIEIQTSSLGPSGPRIHCHYLFVEIYGMYYTTSSFIKLINCLNRTLNLLDQMCF